MLVGFGSAGTESNVKSPSLDGSMTSELRKTENGYEEGWFRGDGWKPKSGDQRAIPMTDRLYAMLSALTKCGRWVFTARVTPRHPEVGRQISERRLLKYLKRVLKRLGYVGHLHTFRHSFISFAANTGVPERLLRQWIRHADREILDWYYHLADRESKEAMQRLSKASKPSQPTDDSDLNSAQNQHNPEED